MLIFTETENQKEFFTSDWHYNHDKDFLWGKRGYKSVNEHNKALIDSINASVRVQDVMFNLGDLILSSSISQFEELLSQIKCQTIYMLWGNHPNRHFKEIYKPIVKQLLGDHYTEESEVYPVKYRNVIYVGHHLEITVNRQLITLNHYP